MKFAPESGVFRRAYADLLAHAGPRDWWPGRSAFEVMVGAILTQNTSWKNVERAIAGLRSRRLLQPTAMAGVSPDKLAPIIRSSGYYNQKALKLHALLAWYAGYGYSPGRVRRVFAPDGWDRLRTELLQIRGVGRETADSILCYAFDAPFFVVDAYTVRWLERYAPALATRDYETLRSLVETEFSRAFAEADLPRHYNEFHALIVYLGSRYCAKRKPLCDACPLYASCARRIVQ